ncbi:unnamed protein product, partial [Amoebophrya sp. A25]
GEVTSHRTRQQEGMHNYKESGRQKKPNFIVMSHDDHLRRNVNNRYCSERDRGVVWDRRFMPNSNSQADREPPKTLDEAPQPHFFRSFHRERGNDNTRADARGFFSLGGSKSHS